MVSRFVLGPLMRSVPVKGSAADDPRAGRVWGHVSLHIKLRAQALKVPTRPLSSHLQSGSLLALPPQVQTSNQIHILGLKIWKTQVQDSKFVGL